MRASVTQIGNSTGLIIPKEIAAKMNIKKGDSVFLTETKDGFTITHYDAEVEKQLKIASDYAAEYREVFRKLAE